jgi:hypothetical protein
MNRRYLTAMSLAALGTFVGPFAVRTPAQRNQPVYPAYDGYVKNADGSYTIAFAYFNHNAEPVTIQPGADNSFGPAPIDRQQPTTFRTGHHRFQCVMVLGPEFDGKLRWTLSYAGTSTGTSEHMLQSNWYLVEGAAELAKIDFAKVPRGVCLNRPPTVRVLGQRAGRGGAPPTLSARISEPLNLFGSVADEGLPRTSPLVAGWKQLSGPGTVTFAPPAVRTRATFSATGTYELELSATDSEFTSRMSVRVVVE